LGKLYQMKLYRPNQKIFLLLYRKISNLKFIVSFYKYLKFLRKLNNSTPTYNSQETKKIVFNLVRPYANFILFFESILAKKLLTYCSQVHILIDDGILRIHDTNYYNSLLQKTDLTFRSKVTSHLLNRFGVYKKYSNFINIKELKEISIKAKHMKSENKYIYKNIDLKPYIDSSVVRYFKSAVGIEKNEPSYSDIHQKCIENAIISAEISGKVNKQLNPDIIITSHGIYSSWGPFYEFFRQKKKKLITYGFGNYRNNTVVFSKRGLVSNGEDDGFFIKYKNKIKYKKAEQIIKKYMEKRFAGKSADLNKFGKFSDHTELLDKIRILSQNKKLFAIFPNVLWDNCITGADTIFKSRIDWIIETINFFQRQNEKILLIRAHPSETSQMEARRGVKEIIEKYFNKVNNLENVLFIDSKNPLKSYSIFPYIHAGIVYRGTIALELMYKGIPVITASKAHYSYKGFSLNFESKEQYFKAFNNIKKIEEFQKANYQNLIKYLFSYFILREIPLTFFDKKTRWAPKLNIPIENVSNDKNLIFIVNTILEKHEFFQEWYWH